VLLSLAAGQAALAAGKQQGKFYVIGMGTSPDLVTVRGLEVIKRADLVLLEDKSDLEAWGKWIGKKPVVYAPHLAKVFYGTDPASLTDPAKRAWAEKNDAIRKELAAKVQQAVVAGKVVAYLQWGDAMLYGNLYLLEMLPPAIPTEVVPGVGAFQAASAALERSTVYGWDTNGVILTMGDWPGRADTNEKLMAAGTSMVFYTMHLDYPAVFAQLARAYPADTPVAVVSFAGDPRNQKIERSTVGKFLTEVDWAHLPAEMHTLFVGKFLTVGQARKDGVSHGKDWIQQQHGDDTPLGQPTCEQP